jgi:hypothetical protein
MPQLYAEGPWVFFCYSNERQEPPHVHVRGPNRPHAKFWLDPQVTLADPGGYNARELHAMREVILTHRRPILKHWRDHFRAAHHAP